MRDPACIRCEPGMTCLGYCEEGKFMATPESIVKKEIKAYLDSIGAYYFMPVQMGYGAKTLDFLCCVNRVFIAIEAKAPGKEPTTFQLETIKAMQKAGAVAFWADNIGTVKSIVELYRGRE